MDILRLFPAICLLGLLCSPAPAFAWGSEGHKVIAHIAALNLTPRASGAVAALLGGDAEAMMAKDANWADEIRDDQPQTSRWHYVDLEVDGDLRYSKSRDCPREQCIVAQILRDEEVLRLGDTAQKAEALKFLIHFAGDIRQPLHAGEDHDAGGNRIRLIYRGVWTNLHQVWDDDVVSIQGRDPVFLAHTIDAEFTQAQKLRMGSGTPQDWAEDSARVARDMIYHPSSPRWPRALPDRYAADGAKLARLQMAKAGFSLAVTLNTILR
jgi:hypothetical protein